MSDRISTNSRSAHATIAAVVFVWATAVVVLGDFGRVAENIETAITMIAGSFVAGSTPQGGGAVAFPVLTKLFGVSAADARTFSLSIQAIGMGTAAVVIMLTRTAVHRRALRTTIPCALGGFLVGVAFLAMTGPSGPYLKVGFTLLIALTGLTTWRARAMSKRAHQAPTRAGSPVHLLLAAAAFLGGIVSSLVGSGADVAVYLVLTIVIGVSPRVGVATSVVTMAVVSVAGLVAFGLVGGGLLATSAAGTDLFGMWLAAIPVVAVGAPLGSWAAQRVPHLWLVRFIATFALLEVVTTALFLDQLRSDPRLLAFSVAGLMAAAWCARLLVRRGPVIAERVPVRLPPPDPRGRVVPGPAWPPGRLFGVASRAGVVNPPDARYCRQTGLRLPATAGRVALDASPPLGVVVLDDGSSFSVDGDVVLGRDPDLAPELGGEDAMPHTIHDPSMGVSRRHLLLRTCGWDVEAVDLGTRNGTFLRCDDGGWQRLLPGVGRVLRSDTELRVGGRTLKFHLIGR